jgi:hypothetical protein
MNVRRTINWMDREEIVKVLENYGFACYDSETDAELREALFTNVELGTIPKWELNQEG